MYNSASNVEARPLVFIDGFARTTGAELNDDSPDYATASANTWVDETGTSALLTHADGFVYGAVDRHGTADRARFDTEIVPKKVEGSFKIDTAKVLNIEARGDMLPGQEQYAVNFRFTESASTLLLQVSEYTDGAPTELLASAAILSAYTAGDEASFSIEDDGTSLIVKVASGDITGESTIETIIHYGNTAIAIRTNGKDTATTVQNLQVT